MEINRNRNHNRLIYKSSFYKLNDDFRAIAKLRDPLLVPRGKKHRIKLSTREDREKDVEFGTTGARDLIDENTQWIYFGDADSKIGYRSIYWPWAKAELEKRHNLLMVA